MANIQITDEHITMMNKLRDVMDVAELSAVDRKAVIILLTANYVVTTNELLFESKQSSAQDIAKTIHRSVCGMATELIKLGGIQMIDGAPKSETKQ